MEFYNSLCLTVLKLMIFLLYSVNMVNYIGDFSQVKLANLFMILLYPGECVCYYLFNRLSFLEQFFFIAELRKYRDFPYMPCIYTCIALSIINILCQSGLFVKIDEPPLTHYSPDLIAYIRIHSGCCIFCGFE